MRLPAQFSVIQEHIHLQDQFPATFVLRVITAVFPDLLTVLLVQLVVVALTHPCLQRNVQQQHIHPGYQHHVCHAVMAILLMTLDFPPVFLVL